MVETDSLPADAAPRFAVLGLSSGIFLVIAALIAVAFLAPRSAGAAVAGASPGSCPLAEVWVDQGYGVTRPLLRPVCIANDNQASAENSAAR